MKPVHYPFAAVVGQDQMKLALLLAAVDWRLGVLLRGDKGAGKTTAARGLAALLPSPAPFINLPIGATEDRLLGGLHLERALQGEPVLKPGLLAEAHGGVLYIDEINLLPAHLGDALLDAASGGVHLVEREGFSASYNAQFVLLGSMNPEEGSLRPQLLDRFALCVDIAAPLDPAERQAVVERRLLFESDAQRFLEYWSPEEEALKNKIAAARESVSQVLCSSEIVREISERMCQHEVTSLRADLAAVRAAIAYAGLCGDDVVTLDHVLSVFPLVLSHRRQHSRKQPRSAQSPPPPPGQRSPSDPPDAPTDQTRPAATIERIFAPKEVNTPAVHKNVAQQREQGNHVASSSLQGGLIITSRRTEAPAELDLRATLSASLRENGTFHLTGSVLHERVRAPRAGTRYLFVIDSSGSHASQQRMSLVKGAAAALLTRSFKREDEVVIIAFRGTAADVILEPSQVLADAIAALEYLPTGGRTPLAHALERAREYVQASTLLILLTDGRANVTLQGGDPGEEALQIANELQCAAIIVDTAEVCERSGLTQRLADALRGRYLTFDELTSIGDLSVSSGYPGRRS